MSKQRRKGTVLESAVRDYLAWALDDPRVHRETLHGARDVGDIGGVVFAGEPVVIECKNTRSMDLAAHVREAEREAGNADTTLYAVVQKRPGVGIATLEGVGEQYAVMPLSVFARLLNHGLPLGPDSAA